MLRSNHSTQQILIFGSSVFEEGIARLLARGMDLQVSSARYVNELAFLDEVAQKKPDVILLNESIPMNRAHIFKLLFSIPSLAGLRIIVTRLSNNIVDVYMMPNQVVTRMIYDRRQVVVTKQDELVEVVRG